MSAPVIVASTPAWNEPAELLDRCARSVVGVVDRHRIYAGGIERLTGGPWKTQAEMRDAGRAWAVRFADRFRTSARAGGRDVWLVQLDADEVLVHGELLPAILERYPHNAYPIAYVQENGDTTLAPFKVFRARGAKIVACCEYVRFGRGAPIVNLAGYACPPELRDALLELPFIFHTPGLRAGIRRGVRLSREELIVETRPAGAIQWPLPPLTLSGRGLPMATEDEGGSIVEHDAGDGDYFCPGCGARYDTPGVCTGAGEAGHEPLNVAKVKGGADAEPEPAENGDAAGIETNGDAADTKRTRTRSRGSSSSGDAADTKRTRTRSRGSSSSGGDAGGPSIRELRAEAKGLKIVGYSRLSKADLATAIANAKETAAA